MRDSRALFTTSYRHWHAEERDALFPTLAYLGSHVHPRLNRIAQVGALPAIGVLAKIEEYAGTEVQSYYAAGRHGFIAHYHRSPRYWIRSTDFHQHFKSATRSRSVHHFRDLIFRDEAECKCVCAILNSSLFFLWFMTVCNGRNLTGVDVGRFPVGRFDIASREALTSLFARLMKDYKEHSFVRQRTDCEFQEFRPGLSKPIIDEIDRSLARHYGLTAEEVDFICNYDIKYRMGDGGGESDDNC
jgi:hypothetical protein